MFQPLCSVACIYFSDSKTFPCLCSFAYALLANETFFRHCTNLTTTSDTCCQHEDLRSYFSPSVSATPLCIEH